MLTQFQCLHMIAIHGGKQLNIVQSCWIHNCMNGHGRTEMGPYLCETRHCVCDFSQRLSESFSWASALKMWSTIKNAVSLAQTLSANENLRMKHAQIVIRWLLSWFWPTSCCSRPILEIWIGRIHPIQPLSSLKTSPLRLQQQNKGVQNLQCTSHQDGRRRKATYRRTKAMNAYVDVTLDATGWRWKYDDHDPNLWLHNSWCHLAGYLCLIWLHVAQQMVFPSTPFCFPPWNSYRWSCTLTTG